MRFSSQPFCCVVASTAWSAFASTLAAQAPLVHHVAREGVLGTSCELVFAVDEARDEALAGRIEAAVFAEVDRLEAVLSGWRDDSELAQVTRDGTGQASADLCTVLQLARDAHERSGGAFDVGVGPIAELWREAARSGHEPDGAALQRAVDAGAGAPFALDGDRVVVRRALALDGIAKGYVVDRAFAAGEAAAGSGAQVLSLAIGGDLRVGDVERDVGVADPRAPAANTVLCTLRLRGRALASSGGYARGFDVAGTHHSHILDPHSGRPCDGVLGASVVAADAATADQLATELCVRGAADLDAFARERSCECTVVTSDGRVHASAGWGALHAPADATAFRRSEPWRADFALTVDFTLRGPDDAGGGRRGGWKRPYVAVWIEDLTETPVCTLCLWLENRRWLRDLRRWSRQYRELPHVEATMSQATRKPGDYTVRWDGTDDDGRRVAPGRYTVCIEAVREHGGYALIRKEVELGNEAIAIDLPGNGEVARAALHFARHARSER